MIPILFNHDATDFSTHGIGDLYETIRCESVVNDDGEYEMDLDYPAGGEFINQLTINNIIVAKVNDHGAYQAFRIYGLDKAINSLVTVHCQHLSYDLACVPVKPYESTTCADAVSKLKTNAVGTMANPFTFYTNVTAQAQNVDRKFKMEDPKALRAALLDGDESIKGTFGGDLIFDNYSVQLLAVGGADRGMLVEYGIDMMDMDQEESISEMITGVFPYWKGRQENSSTDTIVYGDVQYAAGTFSRQRIIPLDVAEYYPNNVNPPSVIQINQTARDWMTANEVGQPEINLKISYAEMGKDVRLHDAITVRFLKIGIDVKAKVISYKYDTLKERCVEIQVGNVKPSILFSLEDASRLKRGLIPPARIQNNSITEDKLGTSSVSSGALQGGSVGTSKIAKSAVTEEKIGQWAVTEDKLGPLSVSTAKIQNGAVDTLQLHNLAVTHDKIGEGEVYTANLGDFQVTSMKIKDGEVINSKIYAGPDPLLQIDGKKLQELSVTSAQIGESAITSTKILDGSVVNAKIYHGTNELLKLDGQYFKELSINNAQIGDSAITSTKILDGSVINSKIYQGNNELLKLDGQYFKELSINNAQIGNSAITSVKIMDGEVVEGKIGTEAVSFEKVKDANIDQLKLNDFSITSTKIADGDWAYNYATKLWERRDPAVGADAMQTDSVGTYALQNSAVVTAKIGDTQVAEIKLVQTAQNAIAAVWEIDRLVSNTIDSSGRVSCSTIIVNYEQFTPGNLAFVDGNGNVRSFRVLMQ